MSATSRVVIIVGAVVSALLVAGIVVVVVLLNTVNAQAEQADYQACMARYGFEHDAPPPVGMSEDDTDAWISGLADAAARCSPS